MGAPRARLPLLSSATFCLTFGLLLATGCDKSTGGEEKKEGDAPAKTAEDETKKKAEDEAKKKVEDEKKADEAKHHAEDEATKKKLEEAEAGKKAAEEAA